MHKTLSAILAGRLSLSTSDAARTVSMLNARQARITRTAISPLLAIRTLVMAAMKRKLSLSLRRGQA